MCTALTIYEELSERLIDTLVSRLSKLDLDCEALGLAPHLELDGASGKLRLAEEHQEADAALKGVLELISHLRVRLEPELRLQNVFKG